MNRKEFIRSCGILVAGAQAGTLFEGCAGLQHFAAAEQQGNRLAIRQSEFTFIRKEKEHTREFVMVRHPSLEFPVCVYRNDQTGYTALSTRCTHRSCEVKPAASVLVCPCHGSEFDTRGRVLGPPADEDLFIYKTTTDDAHIYIYL